MATDYLEDIITLLIAAVVIVPFFRAARLGAVSGFVFAVIAYAFFYIALPAAILVGAALALSSTAIVLQILIEQKTLTSVYGRACFSLLLLQGIAVVPLLALLTVLVMPKMVTGLDVGFALSHKYLLLTDVLFQQLILVVLLSMLAAPVLSIVAQKLLMHRDKMNSKNGALEPGPAPIVVAGFGRVGQRIGVVFSIAKQSFVALDANASVVEKSRVDGYPVFYGDV